MSRSVSTIHRATFTCDYCGEKAVIELDSIKYERSQYVSGEDEVPAGWVMASSGLNPRKSDSIPDVYFDSEEHFTLWKARKLDEIEARMVRL